MRTPGYRLVESATGRTLQVGDAATTFRGEAVTVTGWEYRGEGSSGRAYVKDSTGWEHGYFPSVIGAEVVRDV